MRPQRWLITGASGQLGGHVVRRLAGEVPAPHVLALAGKGDVAQAGGTVERIDLADLDGLRACVKAHQPTHVIHAGAMTSVADAFAQPERATCVNTRATQALVEAAVGVGARFLFCSTDMVFDGAAAPYHESDAPAPLSHYGRTKADAEQLVLALPGTLAVRLPLMYGFACGRRDTTFARQMAALRQGQPLRLFVDEFRTPIWLGDAAAAVVALARGGVGGIIHVAGPRRMSRYEMVEEFAGLLNIPEPRLVPIPRSSADAAEPRPEDLSLDGTRFVELFPNLAPGPIRWEVFADQPE